MGLIFKIIGFFWRVIWRLLGLTLLVLLLFIAFIYFSNPTPNREASVSQALQGLVARLDQFFDSQGLHTDLTKNVQGLTDQLSDEHSKMESGVRWEYPSATIYIDTQNPTFQAAYQTAIEAWNQTGAFSFQIVHDKATANIIAGEMNDGSVTAAGEAESQTNLLTKRFSHVVVRLNSYYLMDPQYGYSYERIVNTAEHELGHAIGLEHNENESVMQAAGSYYSIQESDIQAVRSLYQDQVSKPEKVNQI
ncbi:matrixin family metalloprotease [Streptococcus oricebi]|uniref:Peptidase n=1 Tax=Streptococcus oricebi TaxID=1547447 RepID=A0ABS5B2C6_9STRE|nr:matrixin family metalloprotease [Streptococcus oricebi]MBP2622979.1 peptidase [Streptococcus oricebi]